ncbi:class I adenylate-forming enzyme family protein [Streptomyces sp. bgisy031]|uniref:class I adenylate-forming enzyme family protein n=1 Tax=Streptomyces sp. bgisy031 TaxID=3413772 RepID=UPI003D73ED40
MSKTWPAGMPSSLDYPNVAFDAVLAGSARAYPDRVALRDGARELTFVQLHDQVRRIAQGLRRHGVRPGDMVALHMPNTLWYPVAYFAALTAGATACPINPAQPAKALRTQLEDFGATAIVTHPSCAGPLADARTPELRLVVAVAPTEAAPCPPDAWLPQDAVALESLLVHEPLDDEPLDPQAVAHLQLTGGTTGRSKGVRVLHRNLIANIIQTQSLRCAALPVEDGLGGVRLEPVPEAQHPHSVPPGAGVTLAIAPYFHGFGLLGQCGNILIGATVVIHGRFDPQRFLDGVEHHRVNQIAGAPAFYHALLASPDIDKRDLTCVRSLFSGAAPIDTTTLRRLAEVFPNAEVTEGYGLSEATAVVTLQKLNTGRRSPVGSVGTPVHDTVVELRDADGTTQVPCGEAGEIWVRGPQITAGYHSEPGLTAEQFRDGWLRTGDLGRFDEQGDLYIVGRAKDMIIYKGYNVYPAHLEEVLGAHPQVAQSSVVGAPRQDVGEVPVAFVVARDNGDAGPELAELLMAHVAEHVAPYQRIREIRFVAELPLTPTGKILKSALRTRLSD